MIRKQGQGRAGLAAGGIQFVISSQDEAKPESALLSRLAGELGVPFLAVILHVDDPDRIAHSATQNGAVLEEAPALEGVVIVADPFGSRWAFVKSEPGDSPVALQGDPRPIRRRATLH